MSAIFKVRHKPHKGGDNIMENEEREIITEEEYEEMEQLDSLETAYENGLLFI